VLPLILVDLEARRVSKGGEEIILTEREYALLSALVRNSRHILSHARILDTVWPDNLVTRSNLHTLAGRLKQKLGEGYIVNRRGVGYMVSGRVRLGKVGINDQTQR